MGGLVRAVFGGGQRGPSPQQAAPIEPAAPPPVVTDDTVRVQEERDRMRRRRGTAANVLAGRTTPPEGVAGVQTAAKVLLGE